MSSLEAAVRRAVGERDDEAIAIIGCASEEPPADWCPVDVALFPGNGEQEIRRQGGFIARVIPMERPPSEEIPSMIVVEDPRMRAAALKSGWTGRRSHALRDVARRRLLQAAEFTARA
ncbi:MAG: hypothetical protein ACP5NG_02620, partial [Conexivisphaera sp.]